MSKWQACNIHLEKPWRNLISNNESSFSPFLTSRRVLYLSRPCLTFSLWMRSIVVSPEITKFRQVQWKVQVLFFLLLIDKKHKTKKGILFKNKKEFPMKYFPWLNISRQKVYFGAFVTFIQVWTSFYVLVWCSEGNELIKNLKVKSCHLDPKKHYSETATCACGGLQLWGHFSQLCLMNIEKSSTKNSL